MDYSTMKDRLRREAQGEQADKFFSTMGNRGLPSRAEVGEPGRASVDAPEMAGASAADAVAEVEREAPPAAVFKGSGGYEYAENPDGSFVILKSGLGAQGRPGTVVPPGGRAHTAIKQEVERIKQGLPVASKPKSAAPKSAAPASAKPAMSTPVDLGQSMQETEADRMGETELEPVATPKAVAPSMNSKERVKGDPLTTTPDQRKELSQYRLGMGGSLKRASLADKAQQMLTRQGTERTAARRTAMQLVDGILAGDYNSLASLKALAGE